MINLNLEIYSPIRVKWKKKKQMFEKNMKKSWLVISNGKMACEFIHFLSKSNTQILTSGEKERVETIPFAMPFKWDQFSNSIFVFNDGNIEILNAITVLNINIRIVHMNTSKEKKGKTTCTGRFLCWSKRAYTQHALNWCTRQTIKIINFTKWLTKKERAHSLSAQTLAGARKTYRIPSCDLILNVVLDSVQLSLFSLSI